MYLHQLGRSWNGILAGQRDWIEVELPLQQDERIPAALRHVPSSRRAASLSATANGDTVQQTHHVSNQVSNIHGLHSTPDQELALIPYVQSDDHMQHVQPMPCMFLSTASHLVA